MGWLGRLFKAALADHKTKVQLLEQKTPLSAYLTPAELQTLARACRVVPFAVNERLPESPFYLVIEGSVSVRRADVRNSRSTGQMIELCTRSAGAFFTRFAGQGDFHQQHHVQEHASKAGMDQHGRRRSSSVAAAGETRLVGTSAGRLLLIGSEERLDDFLERCSSAGRDGYDAIVTTNLATVLADVPFIAEADLDAPALRALAAAAPVDTGNEGENHGVQRKVGEAFGVAALLLGAPERKYGIRAVERTLLLHVAFERFGPFLQEHPKLETSLVESTKRFLLQRFHAMHSSIFHSFSPPELAMVARYASFQRIRKGHVVYSAGDFSHHFYVVVHGGCLVDYGADRPNITLRVGMYFGEVGLLLRRTPMLATVTAAQDSTLLTVSKGEFVSILQHNTQIKLSLCVRIQPRDELPLGLLLQHPKLHVPWVDYALEFWKGGLRLPVYNLAASVLRRTSIASELMGLSVETVAGVLEDVLYAQAAELARIIRTEEPSGSFKDQGRKAAQTAEETLLRTSGGEQRAAMLRAAREAEARVCGTIDDALAGRGVHADARQSLHRVAEEVAALCAHHEAMLSAADAAFKASDEFTRLLKMLGVYDEHMQRQINKDDLHDLVSDLLRDEAAGGARQLRSSDVEEGRSGEEVDEELQVAAQVHAMKTMEGIRQKHRRISVKSRLEMYRGGEGGLSPPHPGARMSAGAGGGGASSNAANGHGHGFLHANGHGAAAALAGGAGSPIEADASGASTSTAASGDGTTTSTFHDASFHHKVEHKAELADEGFFWRRKQSVVAFGQGGTRDSPPRASRAATRSSKPPPDKPPPPGQMRRSVTLSEYAMKKQLSA